VSAEQADSVSEFLARLEHLFAGRPTRGGRRGPRASHGPTHCRANSQLSTDLPPGMLDRNLARCQRNSRYEVWQVLCVSSFEEWTAELSAQRITRITLTLHTCNSTIIAWSAMESDCVGAACVGVGGRVSVDGQRAARLTGGLSACKRLTAHLHIGSPRAECVAWWRAAHTGAQPMDTRATSAWVRRAAK